MSDPYVQMADLIGMIPAPFLAEALDDAGTGSANPDVWARIAQDTQNEIDGILGKLYPVPFSIPLPAFIVSAAQLLAADRIYKRRGTEKNPYAADAASIRKEMAQIGEGDSRLTAPGTNVEGPSATVISEPSRLGTRMI